MVVSMDDLYQDEAVRDSIKNDDFFVVIKGLEDIA